MVQSPLTLLPVIYPVNRFICLASLKLGLLSGVSGKEPVCNAGDTRDTNSVPGLGLSPGGGHVNPLQHSCMENPMDRRAGQATVHGVSKSRTQRERLSMHAWPQTDGGNTPYLMVLACSMNKMLFVMNSSLHLLAFVAGQVDSLCLSLPICQMDVIVFISGDCCESQMN